jgi:hypothetical protein
MLLALVFAFIFFSAEGITARCFGFPESVYYEEDMAYTTQPFSFQLHVLLNASPPTVFRLFHDFTHFAM